MSLPSTEKIRVPIIIALLAGETVGLIYFFGHPEFIRFFLWSLIGICSAVKLLSRDWTKDAGSFFLEIVYSIGPGLLALRYWNVGDRLSSFILASIFAVGALTLFRGAVRSRAPIDSDRILERLVRWAMPINFIGPVIGLTLELIGYGFVAFRTWTQTAPAFWIAVVLFFALMHAFAVVVIVFAFFNREKLLSEAKDSLNTAVNQGGRA